MIHQWNKATKTASIEAPIVYLIADNPNCCGHQAPGELTIAPLTQAVDD